MAGLKFMAKTSVKKVTKKVVKKVAQTKIKTRAKKIVRKLIKKTTNKKPVKKVVKKPSPVKLERAKHNPIIKPRMYSWESKATFNPTAFLDGSDVHIVYRAIGESDSSVLGYALSHDGYHILERPTYFIYKRFSDLSPVGEPIDYISGGGWSGGCEDPRITRIGDMVYMLYTAFDGWGSVRIAFTSMPLENFKKKKWHWKKPVFISPPGKVQKNWVLFPEKINGKYAILHSMSPRVMIAYFDSLDELNGKKFIESFRKVDPEWQNSWDTWVRGIGPAPIKTKLGWLLLYHAMDKNDPDRYKLGAIITDIKDPTRILYHSDNPILEPDEHYENHGHAHGVVYCCGAIVKDKKLFVYYGGADKYTCVASVSLEELLEDLQTGKVAKLNKLKKKK
ncbi:MAG: hypothetical protein V4439_00985 [Patescibacteria group bacterium]